MLMRRQGTSFYALVDNVPYTLVGVYCIERYEDCLLE
jgi:hypothetical protein